jgi:hypothetical protein
MEKFSLIVLFAEKVPKLLRRESRAEIAPFTYRVISPPPRQVCEESP